MTAVRTIRGRYWPLPGKGANVGPSSTRSGYFHVTAADNVEIVQGLYAALAERDLDRFAEGLAPEVSWHTPASVPWGGDLSGVDAVRGYVTDLWGFFENYSLKAERFAGHGDQVVVTGMQGPNATLPFLHVCKLADGKLVDWREQVDAGLVMRAIARELTEDDEIAAAHSG